MEIRELIMLITNTGAMGAVAFMLLNHLMKSQEEDRKLFRDSVNEFKEITHLQSENMQKLNYRVENVEKSTERIESKLEYVINK